MFNFKESYNSTVPPAFNNLVKLKYHEAYFVKASENFELNIEGNIINHKELSTDDLKKIVDKYIVILNNKKSDDEEDGIKIPKHYINDEDNYWSDIPTERQELYKILGYTEDLWDDDEYINTDYLKWDELTDKQREAAKKLGYTEEEWNNKTEDDVEDDEGFVDLIIEKVTNDNDLNLEVTVKNIGTVASKGEYGNGYYEFVIYDENNNKLSDYVYVDGNIEPNENKLTTYIYLDYAAGWGGGCPRVC